VPDNAKVDRDDRSGPAGKLRGVHRDFLLLLLYYPYSNGYVLPLTLKCTLLHVAANSSAMHWQVPVVLGAVRPPAVASVNGNSSWSTAVH
jgi:hypothetical protein